MTCQPVKGHSAINTNQLNIIQLFNYPKEKKKKKKDWHHLTTFIQYFEHPAPKTNPD